MSLECQWKNAHDKAERQRETEAFTGYEGRRLLAARAAEHAKKREDIEHLPLGLTRTRLLADLESSEKDLASANASSKLAQLTKQAGVLKMRRSEVLALPEDSPKFKEAPTLSAHANTLIAVGCGDLTN